MGALQVIPNEITFLAKVNIPHPMLGYIHSFIHFIIKFKNNLQTLLASPQLVKKLFEAGLRTHKEKVNKSLEATHKQMLSA